MLEISKSEKEVIFMTTRSIQEKIKGLESLPKKELAVLNKYAMWHSDIGEKDLCDPCNHCSGGNDCHPCGAGPSQSKKYKT